MLWALIIVLLVLAIAGGLGVHPLLFLLALIALAVFLFGPYRRVP